MIAMAAERQNQTLIKGNQDRFYSVISQWGKKLNSILNIAKISGDLKSSSRVRILVDRNS